MDSLLCFLLVLAELVLNKCSVSTSFVFTQGTIAGLTPLSVHGLDRFFHPPNSPQFLCPMLLRVSPKRTAIGESNIASLRYVWVGLSLYFQNPLASAVGSLLCISKALSLFLSLKLNLLFLILMLIT